jgi:hypothetical protein
MRLRDELAPEREVVAIDLEQALGRRVQEIFHPMPPVHTYDVCPSAGIRGDIASRQAGAVEFPRHHIQVAAI